ncbi:MAG: hypothetical protein KDD51_14700 [Bdellovibrionales bacterium]|nr:hypothetical protein [Bdellovibrionales bacterium]
MFVKKFEARSLEKALAMVKAELGPDALVLSTQKVKKGLLQKPMVEVTAAYEKGGAKETPRESLSTVFPHRKTVSAEKSPASVTSNVQVSQQASKNYGGPIGVNQSQLDRFYSFEENFLRQGFESDTARDLTRRLLFDYSVKDLEVPSFLEKARTAIMRGGIHHLSIKEFCEKPAWLLVGTPGVGKTSFAVKLAMVLKRRNREVSLVSLDRRKVLGSSELAAYAKLLDVPFETHPKARDARAATQLVDGFSLPHTKASELEKWRWETGASVLLVLDATARLAELLKLLQQSEDLKVDAICFSKVDLSLHRGVLYEVVRRSKLPFLGLSNSESFRNSLEFYEPRDFVRFVLKEG